MCCKYLGSALLRFGLKFFSLLEVEVDFDGSVPPHSRELELVLENLLRQDERGQC